MFKPFLAACLLILLASAGPSRAECNTIPRLKGLNLEESRCVPWPNADVPQSGQLYAALRFDFQLYNQEDESDSPAAILRAMAQSLFATSDTKEVLISIVPHIGTYDGVETPIYSYTANRRARTYGTSGQFQFSTPYIRYDQQPLRFTLKVRAGSLVEQDVGALIERIKPVLTAARPDTWVLSQAAAPAIEAISGITNTLFDAYYNSAEVATAEFEMADETGEGAVLRELRIQSADQIRGRDPDRSTLGMLKVSVKLRRSMVASRIILPPEGATREIADFSTAKDILAYSLPVIGKETKTVMSGLTSQESDLKVVSQIAYERNATVDISSACRELRVIADTTFGFNDLDTIRMIYELLLRGGKTSAVTQSSSDCFDQDEWRQIAENKIFSPVPKAGFLEKARIDYFATGLRRGLNDNKLYKDQLAEAVEEITDSTGLRLLPLECVGYNKAKLAAIECLDKLQVNRFEIETYDTLPASILFTTRPQVLEAIKAERAKSPSSGGEAKPDGDLVKDSTLAQAATGNVDYVVRASLFHNEQQQIRRIVLERVSRSDIGDLKIRKLGLSCWAQGADIPPVCTGMNTP
jgi:hypothetical protein